jgi:hypothetical protein
VIAGRLGSSDFMQISCMQVNLWATNQWVYNNRSAFFDCSLSIGGQKIHVIKSAQGKFEVYNL